MTKIKICGLRRKEDIEIVNTYKPDYAGFIINYPKSFRSLTADEAASLTPGLAPEIAAVGVFVNSPLEEVARLLNSKVISMAQLHGDEDEDYIKNLRQQTDRPLIKAFVMKKPEDIKKALESSADYILLDQGKGSGRTFDWSMLPEIRRPFFLAGGIGEENLKEAVKRTKAYAVDLSSALETEKCKDRDKIRRVMEIIRSMNAFPDLSEKE